MSSVSVIVRLVDDSHHHKTTIASYLHPLGFRRGSTSVHMSRTMMLEDLSLVLEIESPDQSKDAYRTADP